MEEDKLKRETESFSPPEEADENKEAALFSGMCSIECDPTLLSLSIFAHSRIQLLNTCHARNTTKNCLTSSLNYANEYKLNIQIEAAKKDVDLETHIEKDKDSYRWLKKKIHRTTARGKSMETNSFDHSGNEQHLSYHQGANLAKKVNHKKAKKNKMQKHNAAE
jgi:hypothetical protein